MCGTYATADVVVALVYNHPYYKSDGVDSVFSRSEIPCLPNSSDEPKGAQAQHHKPQRGGAAGHTNRRAMGGSTYNKPWYMTRSAYVRYQSDTA